MTGAATPMSTEGSSAQSAASNALLPSTDWMYWVVKYAEPIIPNAEMRLRTTAGVNPWPRNRAGEISGDFAVRWRCTKR